MKNNSKIKMENGKFWYSARLAGEAGFAE